MKMSRGKTLLTVSSLAAAAAGWAAADLGVWAGQRRGKLLELVRGWSSGHWSPLGCSPLHTGCQLGGLVGKDAKILTLLKCLNTV